MAVVLVAQYVPALLFALSYTYLIQNLVLSINTHIFYTSKLYFTFVYTYTPNKTK